MSLLLWLSLLSLLLWLSLLSLSLAEPAVFDLKLDSIRFRCLPLRCAELQEKVYVPFVLTTCSTLKLGPKERVLGSIKLVRFLKINSRQVHGREIRE